MSRRFSLLLISLSAVLIIILAAVYVKSDHKYVVKSLFGEYVFVDNPIQRAKTENAIRELNQSSFIGYDFLSPYDETIKEKIQEGCINGLMNFMSIDFYGDGIKWIFSGYPHDESSYFLTNISFSSNKYHVFGITPGDDIFSAMALLESQGFGLAKDAEQEWLEKDFAKGDLFITLKPLIDYDNNDYSKIQTIVVGVRTFYLGNRLY